MANFTKKAIKEAFISLIEQRPLWNITIKDIVKECGINRNSFYYHYQDLPSLIEEIIKEEAEAIIEKYPSVSSIVECFDAITEFASHNKKAIMHIYRSVNREVFERNLMEVSDYFVSNYINIVLSDDKFNSLDKKTVITFYKSVCFGLVMEWLNCEMSEDFSKEIRKIFLIRKDFSKEIEDLLQEQL